jgi:hypothetical protein
MCDLYSWGIITNPTVSKRLGGKKLIFLTDTEATQLIENGEKDYGRKFNPEDTLGHTALAAYYHLNEDDFEHFESFNKVPRTLAKEINLGHLDKMFIYSDQLPSPLVNPRFTVKGRRKGAKKPHTTAQILQIVTDAINRLYPERDNTASIKRVKNALVKTGPTKIGGLFVWAGSPEGYTFWAAIHHATKDLIKL